MAAVATRHEPTGLGRAQGTAALVEAARAGDRHAFAKLYRTHVKTVHGVLLARLPRSELRDALQDVFTTALAKLDTLRDPGAFPSWLATIARNLARDWHKRRREISAAPEDLDERRGPARDLDDALGVLAAIRQLPEGYHEILILRFVEGLRGPEIAESLGLTPGAARVKLHRGVTMLREQLRPTEAQP